MKRKDIKFSYAGTCGISNELIQRTADSLKAEIKNIKGGIKDGYATPYASVNLPGDKILLSAVKKAVAQKKKLNPKILIVVGIGGSNLGTMAVHEALNGALYNEGDPKLKVYFAATDDADELSDILVIAEKSLKRGENILVNVVTKSGSTTETISIFELFVRLLKKYKKKSYSEYVVATTDKDSKLWNFAQKEGYALLEIPKKVGGRFSVFSAVGLFPLAMLGVNVDELQKGALDMLSKCTKGEIKKNPAAISATLIYLQNKRGKKNINDNFIFSTDLEAVGKWYRQLMAESLGKIWNKTHTKKLNAGITPTVSIGSTDLHSMAQLYLGGPRDKFTTFICVEKNKSALDLPKYSDFNDLVESIQGKPISSIMDAIYGGVKAAFKKSKRPYTEIVLPDKSAYSVGQLLQFKMIEMMFLGYLLDVNTFDQPAVELYKKETRKILTRKKS
ncbi:MAG: hypothetical protein ABH950_06355 [Candidatus Altiarchaeota archaeon]